jgi:hypothetical protein
MQLQKLCSAKSPYYARACFLQTSDAPFGAPKLHLKHQLSFRKIWTCTDGYGSKSGTERGLGYVI